MDDDLIWADDSTHGESNIVSTSELDREWQARHNEFHTTGYREGLLAGKEASVQLGFNSGFKGSVLHGYRWGAVRGITSCFASLPENVKKKLVESSDIRTELEALHERVGSISRIDAQKYFYEDIGNMRVEEQACKTEKCSHMKVISSTVDLQAEGSGSIENSDNDLQFNSSCNRSKLMELHRQLISNLENTSLNATIRDY